MARKNPMAIDSIPKELAPYIDQSDYSNWLQNKSARAILTPPTSETPLLPATTVDRDITQPTPIVSTPTLELSVIAHETPLSPALPSQPIAEVNQRSATEKFNFEAFANEIGSRTLAAELLGIPIPGESTTTKERKQKDSEKDRQYISKVKKVGSMALVAIPVFIGAYVASTAGQDAWNSFTNRAPAATAEPHTPPTTEPKVTQAVETTATPTAPEIPMAAEPLNIQPKAEFLENGELVQEDFTASIESIGNSFRLYVRPMGEGANVEHSANLSAKDGGAVINVLKETSTPQVIAPQVAEYAQNNPGFIPTLERRHTANGETPAYWNGKTPGNFIKIGMQEDNGLHPGEQGNVLFLLHGSTKNAGGGDLPALKAGDIMNINRLIDGNKYTFKFVEKEIIAVNKDGSLTDEERQKQIARGYGEDVTYGEVANTYFGHEKESTITFQICTDRDGDTGSAKARTLFRFVLVDQDLKMLYPTPTA